MAIQIIQFSKSHEIFDHGPAGRKKSHDVLGSGISHSGSSPPTSSTSRSLFIISRASSADFGYIINSSQLTLIVALYFNYNFDHLADPYHTREILQRLNLVHSATHLVIYVSYRSLRFRKLYHQVHSDPLRLTHSIILPNIHHLRLDILPNHRIPASSFFLASMPMTPVAQW